MRDRRASAVKGGDRGETLITACSLFVCIDAASVVGQGAQQLLLFVQLRFSGKC